MILSILKTRGGEDWFLGSVTDEVGRSLEAPLSFLDRDQQYVAEIYRDSDDADWKTTCGTARGRRKHGSPTGRGEAWRSSPLEK
jgi:hypothetical protein